INVQSRASDVSATGRAIQANASTGSNGGKGGSATVEASGNVSLDGASIQTMGDNSGGGSQAGGSSAGRPCHGTVTGAAPGELNADGGAGGGVFGTVTITGCGTPAPGDGVAYTGAVTPAVPNPVQPDQCGGAPTLPSPAITQMPSAECSSFCSP